MRRTATRLLVCALALTCAPALYAQAPSASEQAQQNKTRRHPNQVPETGALDPAGAVTPDPVEQAAADAAFGKHIDNVVVTMLSSGAVQAQLDDSFAEALAVDRRADGTLEFFHVTGLDRAEQAVRATSGRRKLTVTFPAAPAAAVVLEDRE